MPRVSAAITLDQPPEVAFAFVADPEQRHRLLPDNFTGFRVTSASTSGPGTRTAFTIVTAQGEHPAEMEISAWDPPHMLVERALGPHGYTMRWSFQPEGPGARVSVATEYAASGSILHRLIDRWFARRALEQSLLVELLRLKENLETRTERDSHRKDAEDAKGRKAL